MAIFTGTSKQLGGTEKDTQTKQFFYGLVQKNVLVTGANGQLGRELKKLSERMNLPFRFFFTDVDSLDITDIDQVDAYVTHHSIQYIVNGAAYTAVDKAETDRESAFAVNATAVENLALVARERGAKLIHVSTDFVFDGSSEIPYKEEVAPRPLSVYGESKLKGEEALQAVEGDWMIIRTSWLYSEFGNNFVKTMLRLMKERERLTVVNDQAGSPTYGADLAEMIVHILQVTEEQQEWKQGIYHFANRGETTWFDFAREIQRLTGIEGCEVLPVSSQEYGAPAQRPPYSVLDASKIRAAFHVEIPRWEEALKRFVDLMIR